MPRIKSRGLIALAPTLALGATTLLGACTTNSDMYLDRRDTITFEAGDAVAANKVAQIIDPWPAAASNRDLSYDGTRMQGAAERYRTNKVTPLVSTQTSSVQYQPVLAPAPSSSSSSSSSSN
ncbi:MAG TPA: pilus assembly protein [Xanthobacteraceae bacterium]|nr:pilus assembly protein [Xanthobacteraceae bacterium]